jgi:membrane protein
MRLISLKEIATLFTITIRNWQEDRAPRLGAALAYYMALSLAPTLLILLAISGLVFGANAAEGRLVSQIRGLVGGDGARVIQGLLKGTHRPSSGITATVLGLVTLFFSATAVVSELKDALNTIWKVPEDAAGGIRGQRRAGSDELGAIRARCGRPSVEREAIRERCETRESGQGQSEPGASNA